MYTVLVVDDSNIIRNRITRSIVGSDYEVIGTATNGLDAISMFRELKPDIVTMDLTMPKMDGLKCISTICEENPSVRIMVISALSDKATGIKALELGASGFICKPFTDSQLIEALKELTED